MTRGEHTRVSAARAAGRRPQRECRGDLWTLRSLAGAVFRWRQRFTQYGADGVIPKRRGRHRDSSAGGECAGRAAGDRHGVGVADLRAAVCE